MKKTLSLFITFIVFISLSSFGQNKEVNPGGSLIGFGIHIEQFKWLDIMADGDYLMPNKIILTFTPSKHFRIEPEFGITSFKYVNDYESKQTLIIFGAGVYGMVQKGSVNFYGGLKLDYLINTYKMDYPGSEDEKQSRTIYGPVIGAEYLFGEHFSIGGEFGLKFVGFKYDDEDSNEKIFITDSGVVFRFYL